VVLPAVSLFIFLFVVGMTTCALADEGMWLFNAPPLKQLKENISSSRRRSGLSISKKPASASTPAGADLRFAERPRHHNHHVGADTLQKMGSAEHNYLRDGFYAKTQADEIKSTD